LADELKKELGLESKLTAGGGGVFDVSLDGKLVFSKKSIGRFPEPGEIVALLKK